MDVLFQREEWSEKRPAVKEKCKYGDGGDDRYNVDGDHDSAHQEAVREHVQHSQDEYTYVKRLSIYWH